MAGFSKLLPVGVHTIDNPYGACFVTFRASGTASNIQVEATDDGGTTYLEEVASTAVPAWEHLTLGAVSGDVLRVTVTGAFVEFRASDVNVI